MDTANEMADHVSSEQEFSTVVITCGSMIDQCTLVRRYSIRKSTKKKTAEKTAATTSPELMSRTVRVDKDVECTFNIRVCSTNLSDDIGKQFESTDAFLIFYDMSRPNTVGIYDSFIKTIISCQGKAVRVIGIKPVSTNKSVKRKSAKSKNIGARWGRYHHIIVDKRENEKEVHEIYRSMARELLDIADSKKTKRKGATCTIL